MHPEYVAIRSIVSRNPQNIFLLLGEGVSYEHFKMEGTCFYNVRQNTKVSFVLSSFFKFGLALIFRPSVIASMGTVNLIPLGMYSIIFRAKYIPIITAEIWYHIATFPEPLKQIFSSLLKIVFYRSYAILVISKSIRNELVNQYKITPRKIHVCKYKISNIFNPSVPKSLKSTLNPEGPIVLTVSRIDPGKGLHYLIEAARIVVEKIPNVKIIIKGSAGPDASLSEKKYALELKRLIHNCNLQEHVKILRFSQYSEIPKYMSASDVFVLSSLSEGLGIVILEALATGVPVIASRVGGVPDILTSGANGLMVEPKDVEGLAEAILKVLTDDKLKKLLIEGGLATIRRLREDELEKLLSKLMFEN